MPLESLSALLADARRLGYALGYFESWDLSSLQGVIDAAEQMRSPVIIGFNGDFLSRDGRLAQERLQVYAALGRTAAQEAAVPCALIFNECGCDDWTQLAIDAGFNIVGVASAGSDPADYIRRIAKLAKLAHARGVAVEAELGELPCGASDDESRGGTVTDPALAAAFADATGVDLLAISVGNIHIKLDSEAALDLDRLAAIRERVSTPLVLHGGSGISAGSLRAAIEMGVTKVNYGTYLKQRCLKAIRLALRSNIPNPHELLGMGGVHDVLVAGRLAVREAVLERIELLGSCGRV